MHKLCNKQKTPWKSFNHVPSPSRQSFNSSSTAALRGTNPRPLSILLISSSLSDMLIIFFISYFNICLNVNKVLYHRTKFYKIVLCILL